MTKTEKNFFLTYCFCSFLFLISTTNYLSLDEIINKAGQMDVSSYLFIATNSPELINENSNLSRHLAQRFLIPYLIGFFSNFLNVEIFLFFKIVNFIFILIFILILIIYINFSKLNLHESLILYSLLTLNPYIIRNHLFQPVQVHDIIFFSITIIFVILFLKKRYLSLILLSFFSIFLRQTSIALSIGISILLLKEKKISNFLIHIILFTLSIVLISYFSDFYSSINFKYNYAYGILSYDFSNISRLFKFLILPLVSFFPLLIIIKAQLNKEKFKNITNIILFFICLMMIAQPILAGPDGSERNVVRITTLCYPILVIFIFNIFDFKKITNNKILVYTYLIGLHLWSLHPTFSNVKIFEFLRFSLY